MRLRLLIAWLVAAILCAAVPRAASAEDDGQPGAVAPADEQAEPTPVLAGDVVPFDGLLYTEQAVRAAVEREHAYQARIDAQDAAFKQLELQLVDVNVKRNSTWWQRHGFWFGVGTGVVATFAVLYVSAQVLDDVK